MTTPTKLIELAERCEKATGPDRELDGLIEIARDPMRETILYNEPGPFPQKAVRGPISELRLTGRDLADYISAPRYTASLDAAMTLFPDGYFPVIDGDPRGIEVEVQYLTDKADNGLGALVMTGGKTMALALCAAALRARSTQETNN